MDCPDIRSGEERQKRRVMGSSLDGGVAILLLAIDKAKNTDDLHIGSPGGLNGLNGGSAGGADVINNDDARTRLAESFHAAASAVGLLGFADQESMDKGCMGMVDAIPRAGGSNVRNQRVGTHSEAADGLRLHIVLLDEVKKRQPGEAATLRVQRGGTAVYVVVAVRSGR